jgi:hypothetical protein
MRRRRVSKQDAATLPIPELLKRYSPAQIKAAVDRHAVGVRKAGTPLAAGDPKNALIIMACVEHRRKYGDKDAFTSLTEDLKRHTICTARRAAPLFDNITPDASWLRWTQKRSTLSIDSTTHSSRIEVKSLAPAERIGQFPCSTCGGARAH